MPELLLTMTLKKDSMARFNRLHPVNSIKKVIDSSGSLTAGSNSDTVLVNTDTSAWADGADADVPIGCTVSSLFLSIFIFLDQTVITDTPLLEWYICKNPGNNLTMPSPGATGGNDNRRWILHEEKGLGADIGDGGGPMVFKGVIKIPPRLRRMGADDTIFVRLLSPNYKGFFCIKSVYKFFR